MTKIAIIYTTFLRESLAIGTLRSILSNWNNNYLLLIGDQNQKEMDLSGCSTDKMVYYKLPYDCGLSYARNFLIQKAAELKIPYILMAADSIEFTQLYDFQLIIDFMQTNEKIAKVGFNIKKRIPYEFNLDLIPNKYFKLSVSNKTVQYKNQLFKKVDICRNFFLAKTESLIQVPYDNELKLLEHEDQAWQLKEANYETYYTNTISANYIKSSNTEYTNMRGRMYREFKELLFKKYNLTSWTQYDPEVQRIFAQWKENNPCL